MPALPAAPMEATGHNKSYKMMKFKSYNLPKDPNIIKKYFLLKDYCKKCSKLPAKLAMTPEMIQKVNVIDFLSFVDKYGFKKKKSEYMFMTKKFMQVDFKDWTKYIVLKGDKVMVINQELGYQKLIKLPRRKD